MRINLLLLVLLAMVSGALWGISPGAYSAAAQESGGEDARAGFSRPIEDLSAAEQAQFLHGAAIFRSRWQAL